MTQQQHLKEALESISEDCRAKRGICSLHPLEARGLFKDICERWPEYSGDAAHPVPHPVRDPVGAYYNTSPEEMWNPEYPYGAARWRLIRFCIEELTTIEGEPT